MDMMLSSIALEVTGISQNFQKGVTGCNITPGFSQEHTLHAPPHWALIFCNRDSNNDLDLEHTSQYSSKMYPPPISPPSPSLPPWLSLHHDLCQSLSCKISINKILRCDPPSLSLSFKSSSSSHCNHGYKTLVLQALLTRQVLFMPCVRESQAMCTGGRVNLGC